MAGYYKKACVGGRQNGRFSRHFCTIVMLKPLCRTTGIVSQAQAFWSFVMQHLPSSGSFLLVMAAVGGKVGGSAEKTLLLYLLTENCVSSRGKNLHFTRNNTLHYGMTLKIPSWM